VHRHQVENFVSENINVFRLNSKAESGKSEASKSELLDTSRSWLGPTQHKLLQFIANFKYVEPKHLVPSFAKDRKVAYVYIKRLEKLGVVKKIRRGLYRVIHSNLAKLLHLPVRNISKPRDSATKQSSGVRQANSTSSAGFARSPSLSYAGLFLDNLRYRCYGKYHQLGRSSLLSLCSVNSDCGVSYCEVTHIVSNDFIDGVVVVYSNVEDFERFSAPCMRVEYRPPKNFVKRNGVASTIRFSKYMFIKAFKALALVLSSILTRSEAVELFKWLSSLWSFSCYSVL